MSCELSKPGQQVTWLKDGVELKPDDRCEVVVDGCVHRLTIRNATLEDEAEYTVKLTDDISTKATLWVEGAPGNICHKLSQSCRLVVTAFKVVTRSLFRGLFSLVFSVPFLASLYRSLPFSLFPRLHVTLQIQLRDLESAVCSPGGEGRHLEPLDTFPGSRYTKKCVHRSSSPHKYTTKSGCNVSVTIKSFLFFFSLCLVMLSINFSSSLAALKTQCLGQRLLLTMHCQDSKVSVYSAVCEESVIFTFHFQYIMWSRLF